MVFEYSTSEHISVRTIFDPITAIAPATDCQTYAIGLVDLPHNTTSNLLTCIQLQERIHLDRQPNALVHDPSHIDHTAGPVSNCQSGMACLILEAEIRHARFTNLRWRPAGVERCEATHRGGSQDNTYTQKGR